MKRKLTALLLAMTFVFATVAPTMAASKQANASSNKTATVSVEKSKRRRKPLAAVKSLFSVKEDKPDEERVGAGKRKMMKAPEPKGKDETPDPEKKETFDIYFAVRNKDGDYLDGATLLVVDEKDRSNLKPWSSGRTPTKRSLAAGNYKFLQEVPIRGYKSGEPIDFTVTADGKVEGADKNLGEFDGKNMLVIEAAKKDGKTFYGIEDKDGKQVAGATLQIKEKGKEAALHEWPSGEGFKVYILDPGDYFLLQSETPKGYEQADPIEFTIDKDGKISTKSDRLKTSDSDNDQYLILEAKKETGKLFFSLRGIDGKELSGANVIIKQDGKTFDGTFVTKDQPTELPRDKGEYELIVTKLPEGYKLEKDTIKFEIKEDGKVVPAEADKEYLETKDGNETLFLKAEPIEKQFFFRLKDSNGKDIIGRELQIKDSAGRTIKWFSEKNAKGINISDFADGVYEFSQTTGHSAAEPIRFTVEDQRIVDASYGLTNLGSYQELALVSKSAKRVVTFSRVDSLGKILLGVEIEIYKDGTKIDSWKSGSDHHKLELEAGVYRYHEAAVVLGHKIAKDFEFEVKTDGSIVLRGIQLGEMVKLKEGGHICVGEAGGKLEEDPNKKPEEKPGQNNQKKPTTDKKAQAKNHWVEFDVAKKDGTLLEGAVVEIYQNGKLLESWTTSNTGYKTQLQPGSYRFHTKTAPQGYQLARDFNFAVNRDGSITLGKLQSGDTVTAKDGRIVVYGDPVSATGTRTSGTTAAASNGRLPKTGDGISPVFYAVGLAAVGAVILGIGIKKRRESVDEVK
ncbi:MSCRAMM family protein [Aedoeadaptatus acetigenes]|uniref:MSCRAMM family protein n=1 Tax=Aedoeadaptatus acetigenes TaxID=2981723 RepID=UPI002265B6F6|nr:SpaA isopeptide-forming pilin-related protein [Aedoeadaptatus acetigenes]MCU6786245.1 SpaA isopeptide-forming pilin-related protein [Aedoeadaptatus acetigenes]